MFQPPPLPRNVEASFRDLSSTTAATRASAARDVVRHALADAALRERAVKALSRALDDDAAVVRSVASVGLGELEAREVLPKLLVRVEDDDPHVRQMALAALGEIGDERALPRLRRALSDARPEVRYQAVIAVGRMAPVDGAATALAEAATDADESVRYIALRVGEERMVSEGETSGDAAAREAFSALLAAARTAVAGARGSVYAAAAILLARAGDPGAKAPILAIVTGPALCAKEDEEEAVELAGALRLTEAIPDLERRAYGVKRIVADTCSFHAKIALARLGHARAAEEIRRDVERGGRDRRAAAVVAAGRARLFDLAPAIRALGADDVDPVLRDEALGRLGKGKGA